MTAQPQSPFGVHVPSSAGSIYGGIQYGFKFANGYGASVVCHEYSYGGPEGKWELAVLDGDDELTYSTPITDEVIGWLDDAGVAATLGDIASLRRNGKGGVRLLLRRAVRRWSR